MAHFFKEADAGKCKRRTGNEKDGRGRWQVLETQPVCRTVIPQDGTKALGVSLYWVICPPCPHHAYLFILFIYFGASSISRPPPPPNRARIPLRGREIDSPLDGARPSPHAGIDSGRDWRGARGGRAEGRVNDAIDPPRHFQ